MHVQASAEDLQQQEASLAFIRSLSQQSGFVSSTTEWRRRQACQSANLAVEIFPALMLWAPSFTPVVSSAICGC